MHPWPALSVRFVPDPERLAGSGITRLRAAPDRTSLSSKRKHRQADEAPQTVGVERIDRSVRPCWITKPAIRPAKPASAAINKPEKINGRTAAAWGGSRTLSLPCHDRERRSAIVSRSASSRGVGLIPNAAVAAVESSTNGFRNWYWVSRAARAIGLTRPPTQSTG